MPASPSFDDVFRRWFDDHVVVLFRVAYRMLGNAHDAEDVVQDTLRSAWVSRHLYDAARSERAWLLAILRRRVADAWRQSERRPTVVDIEDGGVPARPLADPFADELSASMQRALGALAAEIRETLLLVIVGELTHQEVADLLGVPLGTVLSRVSRGRTRLREAILSESAPLKRVT